MTNDGMKEGKNTEDDAEKYLTYMDDGTTPYTPIDGVILEFDDPDGPHPFRIVENDDGELLLMDEAGTNLYYALCQYYI